MKNSISDLIILKHFNIVNRIGRPLDIIKVQWKAPISSWIKINTDGAANGSLGLAGCGGIFRTYMGFCNECFCKSLEIMIAYEAELLGVTIAFEFAQHYKWEGNQVADRLVVHAINLEDIVW
ncbi:hypothetical protein TIFTF001_023284 [Ficus carica]|uniref:RNase H type-1 domain-containing protein n=1 Tax=Ficus carica TaxID=3494 RepID=A0AA88DF71_FICCA|nr:hypothetical protein TIFTF001_023284 [Ficus carica]